MWPQIVLLCFLAWRFGIMSVRMGARPYEDKKEDARDMAACFRVIIYFTLLYLGGFFHVFSTSN